MGAKISNSRALTHFFLMYEVETEAMEAVVRTGSREDPVGVAAMLRDSEMQV